MKRWMWLRPQYALFYRRQYRRILKERVEASRLLEQMELNITDVKANVGDMLAGTDAAKAELASLSARIDAVAQEIHKASAETAERTRLH